MAFLAYPYPTFQPAMRVISAISSGFPVSITTTFAHQYVTGTIVRINVPPCYGMQQLNQQFGPITVTSPTTFTIPIDTTYYDPFMIPTKYPFTSQYPQSVSFAELNGQLTAAVQNVLPYSAS